MKNILFIFVIFTSCTFAQVQDYNLRIGSGKDPDSTYCLLTATTGSNFAGRGQFKSLPQLADLLEPFLNLVTNANMANGNQTITGDRAHDLNGNDFKYQNLDEGRFVIDYNSSKDSAYIDFRKDTFDVLLNGGGGLGKFARMFLGATNTPEYLLQVDDGLGSTSEINLSPSGIRLDADTYTLATPPTSGASTDSLLTINTAGEIRSINQSDFLREQGYYWIDRHGATANDGTNDRDSIQALLDYVESIGGGVVVVPNGVFNVTANAIREGLYIGDNTTLLGFGSGSEIRYTGHITLSSTAIQNRRSSGQYNDYQQRTGNTNVHIRGIKLSFTERTDFKNIGISFGGVEWGSIKDVWVDSCGGYSVFVARTNDTDTIGRESKNIVVDNLKITNMCDVGLEVWGSQNVDARNIDISGQGTSTGFGHGIFVWNGSKNIRISNAIVTKDTTDFYVTPRKLVGFAVNGFSLGDTISGAIHTQNISFDNCTVNADMGFRINNSVTDADLMHRADSLYIRNCNFQGYDTTQNAAEVRLCKTLFIEGCTFDRFLRHLQFTPTGTTTIQNTVSDVTIRDNSFTWSEGLDFYGITDFRIYDNRFYYIFDQAPITIRGGRNGIIKNNYFFNIGTTFDQWCITLNKLNASEVRETRLVEVTCNTACDDRVANKRTDDLITMYDATDSITVKFNVLDCADTDADQYSNTGTGTAIFTTELGLQDHDWYEEGTTRAPNAIGDNIFTEAPQVGMGTNAPETNLHVVGGSPTVARIEAIVGQAQLNLKGTSFGQIENTAGHLYVTNAASGSDLILRTDGSTEKLRLSPTAATFADKIIIPTSTPASASASGVAGTVTWDASYIYICTATNTWKRVAIATW